MGDHRTSSKTFKFKSQFIDKTDVHSTVNVKIVVSLKYLANFWRALEISLFGGEINLILTWSAN